MLTVVPVCIQKTSVEMETFAREMREPLLTFFVGNAFLLQPHAWLGSMKTTPGLTNLSGF